VGQVADLQPAFQRASLSIRAWGTQPSSSIAVAVYANSPSNGFITDDKLQLLGNSLVTDIHKLPHVFGSGVWSFLGYRRNYYRPVQFLVYALLYGVFGPHDTEFHCVMAMQHAANSALVYALAKRGGLDCRADRCAGLFGCTAGAGPTGSNRQQSRGI
jgi:hypothetical protein